MKKTSMRVSASLALMLAATLGVAGCSSSAEEQTAGGSASIGSTNPGDGPLGIETDSLYDDTISEDVFKVFPDEKYNTKTGIEGALQTYEDLNSIAEFWSPRETTNDMKLMSDYQDRFLPATYEKIAQDVKDYGQMNAFFALNGSGRLLETTPEGEIKEHSLSTDKDPLNEFSVSSIDLNEDQNFIVINGVRTWKYFTEGPTFAGTNDFMISIALDESEEWRISDMGWSNLTSRTE